MRGLRHKDNSPESAGVFGGCFVASLSIIFAILGRVKSHIVARLHSNANVKIVVLIVRFFAGVKYQAEGSAEFFK